MPASTMEELSLTKSRVDDIRLCLCLEMHPDKPCEKSPALRQAVNELRMQASNGDDTEELVRSQQRVSSLVSELGLLEYCKENLAGPPESEYFAKMQQFLPRLYIGSAGAASDKIGLERTGITHVVMCLNSGRPPFPSDFQYMCVDVLDIPSVKIGPFFKESHGFIKNALETDEKARVLIHCAAGISRSASIAIAFLMRDKGMTYADALAVVRAVRPFVCPNEGFHQELIEFEQALQEEEGK